MRIAYFDCGAGASGDMLLAAVVDALPDADARTWESAMGPLLTLEPGGRVRLERVRRGAFEALKVDFFVGNVHADEHVSGSHQPGKRAAERHHPEILHPHHHESTASADHHHHHHPHSHHSHTHDIHDHVQGRRVHTHAAVADHHHHAHRSFAEIRALLEDLRRQSLLTEQAASRAIAAFELLGKAEAKVHGVPLETVHFHEVGAFDSVMDIAGFAVAMELLNVERVVCSPVTVGTGFVETAHGRLSVPPPAVLDILMRRGMPVSGLQLPGECLTPTGAALLASYADRFGGLPALDRVTAHGAGAGTRNPEGTANVVRLTVGESAEDPVWAPAATNR